MVGNDAGEQLSILAGTLARLDREAPNYGLGKYNDFNTFYYQAASSTSGGSSGSPVIDIEGRVLALNAGGSSAAASSFYLPLDRVTRALQLIQEGKPVARGTLQTVFVYTPFDEVRRLGLRNETETAVRRKFPNSTGMLVVSEVQRGSPAEKILEPGDILVRINGEIGASFDTLAAVLDDGVGKNVKLVIERGGQMLERDLAIQDLYSVTPDQFLEVGDAVVHNLSWQQARHFNVPIRGVYVANPGYVMGAAAVPRGAVITEVDSKPIGTLGDFESTVRELKDGERVTVRFFTLDDPNTSQVRVVRMDRRWYPARTCKRDDARQGEPQGGRPAGGGRPRRAGRERVEAAGTSQSGGVALVDRGLLLRDGRSGSRGRAAPPHRAARRADRGTTPLLRRPPARLGSERGEPPRGEASPRQVARRLRGRGLPAVRQTPH